MSTTRSGKDDPASLPRFVFVTVGSTRFDALVRAVDDARVHAQLQAKGFRRIVFQIGTGEYMPADIDGYAESDSAATRQPSEVSPLLPVQVFRRAPSIQPYLKHAGLVISHAGVGTVMETLRIGSPLIAVVNPSLMDDHQLEVCLALGKYVRTCRSPKDISEAIAAGPRDVPYPPLDTSIFPILLNEELTTALQHKNKGGADSWWALVFAVALAIAAWWWQGFKISSFLS